MTVFCSVSDAATTHIYTLSLHDALPICAASAAENSGRSPRSGDCASAPTGRSPSRPLRPAGADAQRSEEHTSELQSRLHLVCRLLLEKKKQVDLANTVVIERFVPPPQRR